MDELLKKEVLSVKIPKYLKIWLQDHEFITGNKKADIIETLILLYISMGDE